MTDIFAAAYSNDVGAIRAAISGGVDPNEQSARAGTIPLQLACQGNAIDAIAELLVSGADPNLKFSRISRVDGRVLIGQFPLLYAESREAVDLLIAAGASVNATDGEGRTATSRAIETINVEVFGALLERYLDAAKSQEHEIERLSTEITARSGRIRSLAGPVPNVQAKEMLAKLDEMRCLVLDVSKRVKG